AHALRLEPAGRRRLLLLGEAGLQQYATEGRTGLALEHDEAPGLEPFVVGNARRGRQDGHQLLAGRTRGNEHRWLRRPALQQEIDGFLAHRRSRSPPSRSSLNQLVPQYNGRLAECDE